VTDVSHGCCPAFQKSAGSVPRHPDDGVNGVTDRCGLEDDSSHELPRAS
jgi:hypothetical protein